MNHGRKNCETSYERGKRLTLDDSRRSAEEGPRGLQRTVPRISRFDFVDARGVCHKFGAQKRGTNNNAFPFKTV